MGFNLFSSNKTFKPVKKHKNGDRNKLSAFAKKTMATLGSGNMASAIKLPEGEDVHEWLAVNTVDFYNEISLLYGTMSEFCTKKTCPIMSAGDCASYKWREEKTKAIIECSAPEYIEKLMQYADRTINDESIFPIEEDCQFPKGFETHVKRIFQLFFRVYAHLYHNHLKKIVSVGADAHVNSCFKHILFFIEEFKLVPKGEMVPLQAIISELKKISKGSNDGSD